MDFEQKKNQLTSIIINTIVPLIDNDFVLIDLSYHSNIGDILIWEGEIQFIQQYITKNKMLYSCSRQTFNGSNIKKNTIIILHGGGNFGDLWRLPADFRLRILQEFPNNKIIILPQTVYYKNKDALISDAAIFNKHKNLTICARDKNSYQILKEYFSKSGNNIYMLPDMAFCIPQKILKKYMSKQEHKTLFLKREDKELNDALDYTKYISEKEYDILDWPSMRKEKKKQISLYFLRCFLLANSKIPFVFRTLTDIYASAFFKSAMIKTGVKFVSKYEKIYTTRLHAAILCCLLEKPCVLFNNSYGKNSSFYETWLKDVDGMELLPHAI